MGVGGSVGRSVGRWVSLSVGRSVGRSVGWLAVRIPGITSITWTCSHLLGGFRLDFEGDAGDAGDVASGEKPALEQNRKHCYIMDSYTLWPGDHHVLKAERT